jgi:hypothetical protein
MKLERKMKHVVHLILTKERVFKSRMAKEINHLIPKIKKQSPKDKHGLVVVASPTTNVCFLDSIMTRWNGHEERMQTSD